MGREGYRICMVVPAPITSVVRIRLTLTAIVLVHAGRPQCRLCGQPIDPEGHACPRLN